MRIGPIKPGEIGQFVHCKSGLIPAFLAGPGVGLRFDRTRAILFDDSAALDPVQISLLIAQALGFHLTKKPRK